MELRKLNNRLKDATLHKFIEGLFFQEIIQGIHDFQSISLRQSTSAV